MHFLQPTVFPNPYFIYSSILWRSRETVNTSSAVMPEIKCIINSITETWLIILYINRSESRITISGRSHELNVNYFSIKLYFLLLLLEVMPNFVASLLAKMLLCILFYNILCYFYRCKFFFFGLKTNLLIYPISI